MGNRWLCISYYYILLCQSVFEFSSSFYFFPPTIRSMDPSFFEVIWNLYIDHWAIPLSCRFYKVVVNDTSLWFQVGFIRLPSLRLISMTNITCISGIRQSLNREWPWLITSKIICRGIFYSSYNQLDAMLILLALNILWTQTWFELLHMTINIFLFHHVVNLLQASFINPQAWWQLNSLVFYKTQET